VVSSGAKEASPVARPLNWLALVVLALVAALALWVFDALSLQDLPAHAGLIAMRHRFPESAFEQRNYKFDPTIGPYSLFLFLSTYFGLVFGPVAAVRALATLPLLATPAVLIFARWRLHDDRTPTAGFLGIALSFGFMTLMGLVSFTLALALLLLALTLWLELALDSDEGRPAVGREALFGLLAILVFVAHGYAFILLLGLAGITTLSTGDRARRMLRWRSLVPALALATWSARWGGPPAGSVPWQVRAPFTRFQGIGDKLSLLVTPTLITRTGIDIGAGLVLWIAVSASFVATVHSLLKTGRDPQTSGGSDARSRAHSRALAVAAAAIGALFLVLPHEIGWFGFVDGRLVPLLLFLCIMCIRRPTLGPRLRILLDGSSPIVACAMTALAYFAFRHFQTEAAGYHEVFAVVPSEARVLNLPVDPYSDLLTAHPFLHYDKLIAIDRPVLLSDVWPDRGSALYPTPANPVTRLPSSYRPSDLKVVDWSAYRLEEWDFVLIRTRADAPAPATPRSFSLAKRAGGWWLFRTRPSAERAAPATGE